VYSKIKNLNIVFDLLWHTNFNAKKVEEAQERNNISKDPNLMRSHIKIFQITTHSKEMKLIVDAMLRRSH
jgi:hypothetical protein